MEQDVERLIIDDSPTPPQPPEPGRALRMRPAQIVTFLILATIVTTALAGVYNEHNVTVQTKVGGVSARVQFTTRFRFQQTDIVSVMLRNTTGAFIDSIRVGVDTSYLSGFSEVEMIPEPIYPFVSTLVDLPPGEEREVRVQARGDRFGTHRGELFVAVHGDTTRVKLSTFILP